MNITFTVTINYQNEVNFMKKRRIMAVITSAMCLIGTLSVPTVVFASEVENRDKVYDDSLVLPEETIRTDKALRSLLWDSEKNIPRINAYTALAQDKRTIEVHSVDADVLETVKAFVKEKSLNEELIIYILDEEEEQLTGDGIAPELILPEDTISTDKAIRDFLWDSEKNIRKINAYTALAQDKRTIEVHSVDADVLETVKAFVKENGLNEELIVYILDDEEEQLTDGGIIEGDANCDNEVNMADAVIIMQSLANPDKYTLSERGKKNADTNKDGITNTDALNIQKHLLGL